MEGRIQENEQEPFSFLKHLNQLSLCFSSESSECPFPVLLFAKIVSNKTNPAGCLLSHVSHWILWWRSCKCFRATSKMAHQCAIMQWWTMFKKRCFAHHPVIISVYLTFLTTYSTLPFVFDLFWFSFTNVFLWERFSVVFWELMWVVRPIQTCHPAPVSLSVPVWPAHPYAHSWCPFWGPVPLNPNNSSTCFASAGNALSHLKLRFCQPRWLPNLWTLLMPALPFLFLSFTPSF